VNEMPFFYDLMYEATQTAAATPQTQFAGKQVAAGATLGLYGVMCAARSLTAGGGTLQTNTNTAGGTVFSGGTAKTPTKKNPNLPAANSTWVTGATAITAGTTLLVRNAVGFAQTGGTGGLQPIMQQAAIQVDGGTTPNPVDIEFVSLTSTSGVVFDITLEIGEDI
jgi:hypothetical protein